MQILFERMFYKNIEEEKIIIIKRFSLPPASLLALWPSCCHCIETLWRLSAGLQVGAEGASDY